MKAQASFPYDPDAEEFWASNYILSKLVDVLQIRGVNVASGDNLRVIMTMDDGSESMFLQGTELQELLGVVSYLYMQLEGYCLSCGNNLGYKDHAEECLLRRILDKAGYETSIENETQEVDRP